MKNLLDQIKEQIDSFVKDAEANVVKGNRARKASLELTKMFKEFRAKSIEAAKK